jgi:hypothetical protein
MKPSNSRKVAPPNPVGQFYNATISLTPVEYRALSELCLHYWPNIEPNPLDLAHKLIRFGLIEIDNLHTAFMRIARYSTMEGVDEHDLIANAIERRFPLPKPKRRTKKAK